MKYFQGAFYDRVLAIKISGSPNHAKGYLKSASFYLHAFRRQLNLGGALLFQAGFGFLPGLI